MRWISPLLRGLAKQAQGVVKYMCSHYRPFSRLQNLVNGYRLGHKPRAVVEHEAILNNVAFDATTGTIRKAVFMNRLATGRYVCCVWEKNLKPFAVKMVKITDVRGRNSGLKEVTLENGVCFRGTEYRTRHLYQDRARLAGALEPPTRANILIFSVGFEAKKYLDEKGYLTLAEGVDFGKTEVIAEARLSDNVYQKDTMSSVTQP